MEEISIPDIIWKLKGDETFYFIHTITNNKGRSRTFPCEYLPKERVIKWFDRDNQKFLNAGVLGLIQNLEEAIGVSETLTALSKHEIKIPSTEEYERLIVLEKLL